MFAMAFTEKINLMYLWVILFVFPTFLLIFINSPIAKKIDLKREETYNKEHQKRTWLDEYCDTHSKDACNLMEEIELEKQSHWPAHDDY